MPIVEVENRLLLPVLKSPIARDLAVMFVGLAIAIFPLVVLAGCQPQPIQEPPGRYVSPLRPVLDVIDDFVAYIMGNPHSLQSSPMAFFALTFSSTSSEMTSCLSASFA